MPCEEENAECGCQKTLKRIKGQRNCCDWLCSDREKSEGGGFLDGSGSDYLRNETLVVIEKSEESQLTLIRC